MCLAEATSLGHTGGAACGLSTVSAKKPHPESPRARRRNKKARIAADISGETKGRSSVKKAGAVRRAGDTGRELRVLSARRHRGNGCESGSPDHLLHYSPM